MDSFFGIGVPELVLILILAGIVMGPQRIRHVARTLGSFIGQMQLISRQFTRQLNAELDALDSDEIKGTVQDVKELQREIANLRRQFSSLPKELLQEGKQVTREAQEALKPAAATNEELLQEVKEARRAAEQRFKQVAGETEETPDDEGSVEEPPVPAPQPLPSPVDVPDDPEA